jgi:hypothetical protein
MMRVEICIRKAVDSYGQWEDQVRAAQPRTSTTVAIEPGLVDIVLTGFGFSAVGKWAHLTRR